MSTDVQSNILLEHVCNTKIVDCLCFVEKRCNAKDAIRNEFLRIDALEEEKKVCNI